MSEKNLQRHVVENIRDFDLDNIFDCGQCFRWVKEEDGSYTGTAFGKIVNMKTSGDDLSTNLTIENSTEEDYQKIWSKYLDMDRDYGMIKKRLSDEDTVIREAIQSGPGIRILKQDLWEAMVSFIISQNNNIPRIKGCIENLCKLKGEYVGAYRGKEYFNIPAPEVLAGLKVDDLQPCRLGYRAPYLIDTARQVIEKGGIEQVEEDLLKCDTGAKTIGKLLEFQGVGPKVANCIALFGLGRFDAFPIDVWVRRVMARLYAIDENNIKAMASYATEKFKDLGGIAQQYLFYYIRGLD